MSNNLIYFDEKQRNLIRSWHKISTESDNAYLAFMAEWVAFNAICYNLYYKEAIKGRANIDYEKFEIIRDKLVSKEQLPAESAHIKIDSSRSADKWKIELKFPERLPITIVIKYTENIIFDSFVKDNKEDYQNDSQNNIVLFNHLKTALEKEINNEIYHFVINMQKYEDYNSSLDIKTLVKNGVIIKCDVNNLATIKNILYQVRCNIFHGEKEPGYINDDIIVKAALPLLHYIVEKQLARHSI